MLRSTIFYEHEFIDFEVQLVVHPGAAAATRSQWHRKAHRHLRLLTIGTESRLGTLWDQERCNQFCSKEKLWEAARDDEMKIPWKEANDGPPVTEEQIRKDSGDENWTELVWMR